MLYVKHIESNIRKGCAVELGPKTLIVGKNSTGKSSIINAIELALTGKVSDVAGRTVMAKASDLVSHLAPNKKEGLFSVATLSNGDTCSWRTGIKGKKSAEHVLPTELTRFVDSLFPLRNVRDAILGEPATTRRFFLRLAVGQVTDADVISRIPTPLQAYYRNAILRAPTSDSTLDKLLFALEYSKEEASKATAKFKILKEALANMTQGLPAPTTDADAASVKAELDKKRREIETAASINARWEQSQNIDDRLTLLENAYIEAEAKVVKFNAEVTNLESKLSSLTENPIQSNEKQALIACLRWHVDSRLDECQVCGTHTGSKNLTSRWAYVTELLNEFKVAETQRTELTKQLNSARYLSTSASNEMKMIELEAKQLQSVRDLEITPVDIDSLRKEVAELETRYTTLVSSRAKWESSTKSRDAAVTAENDAAQWKQLVGACNDAIASLLETGVESFENLVSGFLPVDEWFGMKLHEGSRGVCQVGLLDASDTLRTALSGAEWSRMLGALAMACVHVDKPPLAVVVPPVGEFDAETLADVMCGYETTEAQVIIATPYSPKPSSISGDWTVIDLNEKKPIFLTGLAVVGVEARDA